MKTLKRISAYLLHLFSTQSATDVELVNGLFHGLISKLANTRINEFMNARLERDLKVQGKVVDGLLP